ncbi:MAG: DNA replication/repair protein RecF [Gammaproteobacteria bacterium]|nr:MAG: DNA replication/repair protein RecF [Gammaproteobacteria bacterium]
MGGPGRESGADASAGLIGAKPAAPRLLSVSIRNFRCITAAELELDSECSVVTGPNASGKTSLLEALFFLGRGRSFRAAHSGELIQHGERSFLVSSAVGARLPGTRVGVAYERDAFRVRIGGEDRRRLADLAAWVPVSVIDPEVHALVDGPPEQRRRFVDWGVFHVEPSFGETWRRYQRALRQRNAALRGASARQAVRAWNDTVAELGEQLGGARERYLAAASPGLQRLASELVGRPVSCRYQRGWSRDKSLAQALTDGLERDLEQGATQSGPHRADLILDVAERGARRQVSRGQQKLLASALVLGQVRDIAAAQAHRPLLLLDDPAAELDAAAQRRLLSAVRDSGVQRVVTALDPAVASVLGAHTLFHVEQGAVSRVLQSET